MWLYLADEWTITVIYVNMKLWVHMFKCVHEFMNMCTINMCVHECEHVAVRQEIFEHPLVWINMHANLCDFVNVSAWGCKESDTTGRLTLHFSRHFEWKKSHITVVRFLHGIKYIFMRTVFAVTPKSYDCFLWAVSAAAVEKPPPTECDVNLEVCIGRVRLGKNSQTGWSAWPFRHAFPERTDEPICRERIYIFLYI